MDIKYNCDFFITNYISDAGFNLLLALLLVFFLAFFVISMKKNRLSYLGLMLVLLGGGINTYERIRYGCVKDYLTLGYDLYFNFQDIMVVIGVLFLGISQFININKFRYKQKYDE